MLVDTLAKGAFLTKCYEESMDMSDRIGTNNFQWPTYTIQTRNARGSIKIEARLVAQNDELVSE